MILFLILTKKMMIQNLIIVKNALFCVNFIKKWKKIKNYNKLKKKILKTKNFQILMKL